MWSWSPGLKFWFIWPLRVFSIGKSKSCFRTDKFSWLKLFSSIRSAYTICMEDPLILMRIQMGLFISCPSGNLSRKRGNNFGGIKLPSTRVNRNDRNFLQPNKGWGIKQTQNRSKESTLWNTVLQLTTGWHTTVYIHSLVTNRRIWSEPLACTFFRFLTTGTFLCNFFFIIIIIFFFILVIIFLL